MYNETLDLILEKKLIVILRNVEESKLIPLQDALYAQGVQCIEVTFDQKRPDGVEATARAIRMLKEHRSEMAVGAGTVLTEAQLDAGFAAGAAFIISPDSNREIIRATREYGMVSMPGAMTPTEIINAYRWGASIVKVFPAGDLGTSYFRSLKGPINHVPLSAVGGIDHVNMESFYREGVVCFGIGSHIVKKDMLAENDFEAIGYNARLYTEQIERWNT